MDIVLSRFWWLVLIQGIAAVVYGILAFVWPFLTLKVLIVFFAVFAIIYGISALFDAFGGRAGGVWWLGVINGLVALAAGVLSFVWPGVTALALLYLVAVWALVVGVFEVAAATRRYYPRELRWTFGLVGAASILFGVLLILMHPAGGLLALVWLLALDALFVGILWIYRAFRLRRLYYEARGETVPA